VVAEVKGNKKVRPAVALAAALGVAAGAGTVLTLPPLPKAMPGPVTGCAAR
jgi:uncharacterized protein involved in exopolysaccharide biosynthesis